MNDHPRYSLLEKIASGSHAVVYRGRDRELGREVAIKQIHDEFLQDPAQLDRFWSEAQLLASLHHPNIVTMFDLVRERGWIVLELMQGNLSRIAGRRPMDLVALRTTLVHCLRALRFLHENGIVHGDIKPANIMVDHRRRVKVGDFGLARRVANESGSLLKGTTRYMAPEVLAEEFGDVGPASDLYSLGFSAYELMCGQEFESLFPGLDKFGRNRQMAWMMWHAAPDRRLPEINRVLRDVPADLAHVVQKLVQKPLDMRYATAAEALRDLNVDARGYSQGDADAAAATAISMSSLGKDGDPEKDATAKPDGSAKSRWPLYAALGASVLLSAAMLFLPTERKPELNGEANPEASARGEVREVLVERNQLVLVDEAGTPFEVDVFERPKIRLNRDRFILLREIQPGDRASVTKTVRQDGGPAFSLEVIRPELQPGRVRSVDVVRNRLLVAFTGLAHLPGDVWIELEPNARVTLNGGQSTVSQVRRGDFADIRLFTEGDRVRGVDVSARRSVTTVGVLREVDAEKKQLIVDVRPSESRERESVLFRLSADVRTSLDAGSGSGFSPTKPGELQPGDRVRLTHDSAVTEIQSLRRAVFSGLIRSLAIDASSMSVESPSGEKRMVSLAAGLDASLQSQTVEVNDLRITDWVDLWLQDETSAAAVDAWRAPLTERLALLIGLDVYRDRGVADIPHSDENLLQIRDTLINRYAVPESRMLVLNGSPATRERVEAAVTDLIARSTAQTQLIVYISARGFLDVDRRPVLAFADFANSRRAETGLALATLIAQLDSAPGSDKLLLLDITHPATTAEIPDQPDAAALVEAAIKPGRQPPAAGALRSLSILVSCSNGERGLEWKDRQMGLFAGAVCDAFAGDADADRNLRITPREAFDAIAGELRTPQNERPTQTPVLYAP